MKRQVATNCMVVLLGLLLIQAPFLWGHEIPSDVQVRLLVRPVESEFQVLARVPLDAMRDLNWPTYGPGYLDLRRVQPVLHDAAILWVAGNLTVLENGSTLPSPRVVRTKVSLPSDPSFRSFETAWASLIGPPLPETTQVYWGQASMDLLLSYAASSDQSRFSLAPTFSRLGLRVRTSLLFATVDGTERAFELSRDPGVVHLDPNWWQAVGHFLQLGFWHILDGWDHLLFLLCLVIPLRRLRPLVLVVTAFTVAHSITLLAAATGFVPEGLWFPALVETLIALSILYMAIENIFGVQLERRWMVTAGFGLVHGFGFSFALQETLQFAGSHLWASLLSFNLGVEIGQLLVVGLLVPVLYLLFRYGVSERTGTIVLSVLVAHTAWHWTLQLGGDLAQYSWPAMTAGTLASLTRWTLASVVVAALFWLLSLAIQRWGENSPETKPDATGYIKEDDNRTSRGGEP